MFLPIHIGKTVEWPNQSIEIEGQGHMYVISKSGWGKSTLLRVIIKNAMEAGMPVIVIDPHGPLVDACLNDVPASRFDKTIVFDPSDTEYVIPFPLLTDPYPDPDHGPNHSRIIEIVTSILSTLWPNSWFGQSDLLGRNILRAVLEVEPRAVFPHLWKAMVDRDYMKHLFENATSSTTRIFGQSVLAQWRDSKWQDAITAPLNKVDALINKPELLRILSRHDGLNVSRDIIENNGICFVRVGTGRIGDDPAALLMAMWRSAIRYAAFDRDNRPDEKWAPCLVVMDEFHNQFKGENAGKMYAETRKYKVYLCIADQDLANLPLSSESQVLTNAITKIVGATGDDDAKRLGGALQVDSDYAQKLIRFHWLVQRDDMQTRTMRAIDVNYPSRPDWRRKLVEQSRRKWGIPVAKVDADLEHLLMADYDAPKPTGKKPRRSVVGEKLDRIEQKQDILLAKTAQPDKH